MEIVSKYKWVIVALVVAVAAYLWWSGKVFAADLGGNCCADLEERIAELEATSAKKGNRKVSLTIYGQVAESLVYLSDGDESETIVSSNSAAESFVGFAGRGRIGGDWTAGFVLEIGTGEYERGLISPGSTNGIYTKTAKLFIDGPVGKLSIGRLDQASYGITRITAANTDVVAPMLSLRPLNGPQVGSALDIYSGQSVDGIRYDTPVFQGFVASASWSNASSLVCCDATTEAWDIALRYAGEFQGFKVAGGIAYRDAFVVPTFGNIEDVGGLSGSASVLHAPSGLFVSVAAGNLAIDLIPGEPSVFGWHAQGGWENKVFGVGKTTVYLEYAELSFDTDTQLDDVEPTLYGLGVVQSIDAAAMDLYLGYRNLDAGFGGDDDITVVHGGARVRF